MEGVLYTYVEPDGALHWVVTPGDPDDEGIMWVRGRRCATDPEILALLAARALLSSTPVWNTADGRELVISEMSDAHIKNTVRKFNTPAVRNHNGPTRQKQLEDVIAEAKRRNLEIP